MAQLYKMTLYVCDLDDNLSFDEIETLIKQDALDGVAVNCLCRFADRQLGEQIEWDDGVDINRCDCPTSAWDKYFKPPKKPQTNADRIRAMSDEELAAFRAGGHCPPNGTLFDALESIVWYHCHYEWLKELRDALAAFPESKNYPMPVSIKRGSEEHAIMMLLVGMFGSWGSSIGGGWIENKSGCIEFINLLCKDSWEEGGAL